MGFESVHHILHWVDSQKNDLWEQGDRLTAGVSVPDESFATDDQIRHYKNGVWVLGSCPDYTQAERELLSDEHVNDLLEWARQGTLRIGHPNAGYFAISDTTKEDRYSVMSIAVRQALAGPAKTPEDWTGRPVTELIDTLFRTHLNRHNRSKGGEPPVDIDSSEL
jgi:hypothetical protein